MKRRSSTEEPKNEKRKTNSKAMGNKPNSGLLTGHSKQKNRVQSCLPCQMPSETELSCALSSLKNCCADGGNIGCIYKIYSKDGMLNFNSNRFVYTLSYFLGFIDFNMAIKLIRHCRSQTFYKNEQDLDQFMQEKFRESTVSEKSLPDG
jgi:hypothetical protein